MFVRRHNKMLPQKHFDKIEKGAIDHITPSAKPALAKDEHAPKKMVEIKDNALDKNAKDDDDDSEYDYYYDDDIDNGDDIVTVTPKTVSNKTRKCKYLFQQDSSSYLSQQYRLYAKRL